MRMCAIPAPATHDALKAALFRPPLLCCFTHLHRSRGCTPGALDQHFFRHILFDLSTVDGGYLFYFGSCCASCSSCRNSRYDVSPIFFSQLKPCQLGRVKEWRRQICTDAPRWFNSWRNKGNVYSHNGYLCRQASCKTRG
ncbi:unnamed protein product, partial [Scytosiphon promiscuus]